MSHSIIEKAEKKYTKDNVPEFRVGDTVDVHVKIIEGAKSRTQIFNGVVIGRRGRGLSETFTVRRIVNNEGVERVFSIHSPLIPKIEVKRRGKVRRAKLYFLRDRVGKARRLREVRQSRPKKGTKARETKPEAPEAPAQQAEAPEPVGS